MSLKKIEDVKASKWFKIWDVLIYGIVVAAIAVLIAVFTLSRDKSPLSGVVVSCMGEDALIYVFKSDECKILNTDLIEVVQEKSGKDKLTVMFRTSDKVGYNEIVINKKNCSVKVESSNCSIHKDCVYTPALTANGSTPIICTPHSLIIRPLNFTDDGIVNI